MTQVSPPTTTRRERQREATFEEIVSVSSELLAEGAELSLRAVAWRMGMTAPALYRYVASYQELVDLVAFEIDKAATAGSSRPRRSSPDDVPAARLVAAAWRSGGGRTPARASSPWSSPTRSRRRLLVRRELLTLRRPATT